jgi:3-hydroxybutyryl-CoA dehydrogenase
MAIERIVVVGGGGLMGNGICQVVAGAGFQVTMVDLDEAALDRGRGRIRSSLERLAKAGTIAEADVEATLGRIAASTSLEDAAADADHVIETVVEDPALKADVLRRLDAACRDDVILASNTSQISISRLAAATSRPDRVVGSHWFNPRRSCG